MPTISFSVIGQSPVPWGSDEWRWRRAVADKAREIGAKQIGALPPDDSRFEIDIIFHLSPATLDRADLDNLAKPVLDTIFRPRNAQVEDMSLTGALFPTIDDDRVFRLTLEKKVAPDPDDQGIDILVIW